MSETMVSWGIARLFLRQLLESPLASDRRWSLQGFGMLRLYLTPDVRLHVWSERHRVPDITDLHDHPWSFESVVLVGSLVDRVFAASHEIDPLAERMVEQQIVCGEGGGKVGGASEVWLKCTRERKVEAVSRYIVDQKQIHSTQFVDGTVTVCQRYDYVADRDRARVFHRPDRVWKSAEPRPATDEEVLEICAMAAQRMNLEEKGAVR